MNLEASIGDLNFKIPIYNASGPRCTTFQELTQLSLSESAAILTKSTTLLPRDGNPEPRYWGKSDPLVSYVTNKIYSGNTLSINSTGLANLGYEFYGVQAKTFNQLRPDKPFIISIAGLSLEDNLEMIRYYHKMRQEHRPKALEINLSCPNISGKPQVGYDLTGLRSYIHRIYETFQEFSEAQRIMWGVKLPPYFDQEHFQMVADVLKVYPMKFVTCVNSLGNGLFIDTEKEETRIKPNGGFGGVGGNIVLPIALANVHRFRQLLPENIKVIGCGGVRTGEEVFQHILAGAEVVQIGTQYMEEGPKVFERLRKELEEIMDKKGYDKLEDFRGKLKVRMK